MKSPTLASCIAVLSLIPLTPVLATGWSGSPSISDSRQALPASNGWKSLHRMPRARTLAAAAAINGIVYVAGGINVAADRSLFAYNVTTRTWTTLTHMPGRRYEGNGAAVIDGQLYVAGGWTRTPPLPHSSLYAYDPPSNTWSIKASMSHLSACGATGAIGGKLYVLTACDGNNGYSSEFDVYDPASNSWSSLPSPSNAHAAPGFGVVRGRLIVAGGFDASGTLKGTTEAYDPKSKSWSTLSSEPQPVLGAASAAVGGRLIVAGGSNGTSAVASVQVYDSSTDSWSTGTSLPTAIVNAAGAVQQGFIFVEGGSDATGNVKTNLRCRARSCGG
jgi:N-acetylneuraminic acid mutarotase